MATYTEEFKVSAVNMDTIEHHKKDAEMNQSLSRN